MKITVESTSKVVTLNGVPARVWEGHTEEGIPIHCFITRVAVARDQNATRFEVDLQECAPPSAAVEVYPARLVL